ncbi:MAG: acyl-CoA thioesterase [Polyangiaceae bacterium]|nr:acyl-CoA thioesterase [Polyangiaceae bacterium]
MRPREPQFVSAAAGAPFVRDERTDLLWHRVTHRTLYVDTDRSQVVYHANYLRYFELGRATLLRDVAFPYREVEESGYVYPIVDTALRFVRPLYYDDLMWIHTRPQRREPVAVTFDYLITRAEDGALVCTGHTRHCALNTRGTVVEVDPKTIRVFTNFPTE